ncbi:lysyl-tRNA synthetase [Haloarcula marismortui ATCC 43049]|uniref:Lysine--tRNA ligase n=2 Tax=Haloarcula marismortui (strain ATCC 43049 / DSM 3752 / JCM 8966 / VKM B-1809) TaxID=272569 RepID=SYK_HALMA|nr:lysine--tRNA ligase [Haloarcula marismortui]Q5UXX4.1 RecName: Full=Lysine--tRNA ligase; AltName: Full=Lysyl-tRNA synthetase; Short=LysRS [Haloarcula marismortui ATCC 43049]AAV47879.1 lysyl-tRNA synthetase [Haloarcula marismortui ATCC 43049]QCP92555.1 lysine--tRNA ligase [Haloarcula marismortui ATCC 43049]
MAEDPYEVGRGVSRAFWADSVADAIEARDPDEPIVIKGGVSPSGVPHIGHFNEIMRGYYVAEALRDRGHEVRQVFTADDKDRLRAVPRQLADLDWNVVGLGEVDAGALGRNLGKPYTDIPDPFGCCDSYGAHFTALLQKSAELVGVDVEFVSNTELYADGEFEAVTRRVLERADRARDVLAEYQNKVDDDYVPFLPQCAECGKITEGVTAVDLDAGEVEYVCEDVEAGDQTIDGCGHEGTATLRDGKLPWRFEWPAQWEILGVDFEPFGKDHAEGSWPSGEDVAENVLDIQPPVPMVYEWFTLDGEPLSSSSGNVITVDEVLDILEPEVFKYFFVKDPRKQRDFSVENIDQLVDEFDRFERRYFEEIEASEDDAELAERAYPMVVDDPREQRIRIPYTFAAVLGMTDDPALREQIARKEGHIPDDAPEWAVEQALARVERAQEWASLTNNEFNYELKRAEIPEVSFDDATAAALDELADFIAEGHDGEAIQSEIYETAKRNDIDISEFFSAGYRLLFDDTEGPQLGTFIAKLDREFVVERFRRNE